MAKKKTEDIDHAVVEETTEAVEIVKTIAVTVTAEKLNVRKKPNTSCDIVKVVTKGAELNVFPVLSNGFYELSDGSGFVMSDYVTVK